MKITVYRVPTREAASPAGKSRYGRDSTFKAVPSANPVTNKQKQAGRAASWIQETRFSRGVF